MDPTEVGTGWRVVGAPPQVIVYIHPQRFSAQGEYMKVTEATLTYVAIDEAGKPRVIPKD